VVVHGSYFVLTTAFVKARAAKNDELSAFQTRAGPEQISGSAPVCDKLLA
jgi:hypothetical protein